MPIVAIVIAVIVVLLLLVLIKNVVVVRQSRAYVIERLGAFHAVWGVGIHFKLPFIERVAKVVSLKEQVVDFAPQPVITKDNVTMQIDTVVFFEITDPKLYTYGVEHPMPAIENLTATTLRNIIGELELDQSLTSRDVINTKMRAILDEATDPWGIRVNRVEPVSYTHLEIARANAVKAEVEDVVRFDVANAMDFRAEGQYGRLVTNPPYGERLLEKQEAGALYRQFGQVVRRMPPDWRVSILSSHTEFEDCLGLKAVKKRKLYNGCLLYTSRCV